MRQHIIWKIKEPERQSKPDVLFEVRHHESRYGVDTYRMEQHTVSYSGLDILRSSITGILSQKFPCLTLAVKSKQSAELWFAGSAVINTAITGQNSASKGIYHVFFRIHTHLQEQEKFLRKHIKIWTCSDLWLCIPPLISSKLDSTLHIWKSCEQIRAQALWLTDIKFRKQLLSLGLNLMSAWQCNDQKGLHSSTSNCWF